LFGWLHVPAASNGDGAVLIPPIGIEAAHADRFIRLLARRLCARGLSVLRFHLQGSGDSFGTVRGWTDWCTNAVDAVEALRQRTNVAHPTLVGAHMGALLALHAAAHTEINNLVLIEPCWSGRDFLRKVRLRQKLEETIHRRPRVQGVEAGGFAFPEQLCADLEALQAQPPRDQRRVLVIEGKARELLTREVHEARMPEALLHEVADWVTARPKPSAEPRSTFRTAKTSPAVPRPRPAEEPLRVGDGRRLFGIRTDPVAPTDLPAIVLPNAGCLNHEGPHRRFVEWTRRWATLGHTCLRLDLGGLGESAAREGCGENIMYPEEAVDDLQSGLDVLRQRRIVLLGLCSGAVIAFQAALRDPRVVALWMLNADCFDFASERGASFERGEGSVLDNLRDIGSQVRRAVRPLGMSHDRVLGAFAALHRRGLRMVLGYGEEDRALTTLRAEGELLERLRSYTGVEIVGRTSHTFLPLEASEEIFQRLSARLAQLRVASA
jgi:pimeloyl-ACP methyl ester carboxylesterase